MTTMTTRHESFRVIVVISESIVKLLVLLDEF